MEFMRNFKVVWIAVIAMAFAANAYATAFAASCDCVNTIPAETVKVDMQCHDADVPDPASDVDGSHHGNLPDCDHYAHGHCQVSPQTPLLNSSGMDLASEDGGHGFSAKVPKPPLSYGIDYPPKHTS